jgi:RNA polymerase sigma-70 factor (ECF subfamily)
LQAYRHYLLEIAREEIDQALQAKGGASDLVQETFLEASCTFPRFKGESAVELRAWLRCLLLRRVIKHGRHYRNTHKRWVGCEQRLDSAEVADLQTPSQMVSSAEEMQRLNQALEQLPDDYRRVIHLRYREGHTFEEIGPLMGRTANAVRLLWLRAVERVKNELRPPTDG